MDLSSQRRSTNIDDQRRGRGRTVALGGGTLLVVLLVGTLLGADPMQLLQAMGDAQNSQTSSPRPSSSTGEPGDDQRDWVAGVLGSTEDTWAELFRKEGLSYTAPTLVLFERVATSACGRASSATGPFYCPADQQVYLDLTFFDELSRRFRAPGDFANAYVIAHEVGHHVQNLTGVERKVRQAQRNARGEADRNALSVRMELQADCYAGVWAHRAQKERPFLQEGDLDEALQAATAIGDDRLQKQARGHVVPETFTHGTSEQRKNWFSVGFRTGSLKSCNTFEGEQP